MKFDNLYIHSAHQGITKMRRDGLNVCHVCRAFSCQFQTKRSQAFSDVRCPCRVRLYQYQVYVQHTMHNDHNHHLMSYRLFKPSRLTLSGIKLRSVIALYEWFNILSSFGGTCVQNKQQFTCERCIRLVGLLLIMLCTPCGPSQHKVDG